MVWYVIFSLAAVMVVFMSGFLYRKGDRRFAAGIFILSSVVIINAGAKTIREAKFGGYASTTPEPAIYNVIFIHELGEDEILVAVHIDSSSYKRVFQLKKEWLLDKNIPFAPEHLVVLEGDEEQLVVLFN